MSDPHSGPGWEDEPASDDDDFGYRPDPDFDAEQRANIAEQDVRALTQLGIFMALALISLGLTGILFGIPGADSFTRGSAVGATVAVINLRILARAAWTIFEQQVARSLAAFGASFAILLATAVWLVRNHPEWSLGYAVGLALPGAVGIAYAWRQHQQP